LQWVASVCATHHRSQAGVKTDIAIAPCDEDGIPYSRDEAIEFSPTEDDGPTHEPNDCEP
jgi:hypothetical protein